MREDGPVVVALDGSACGRRTIDWGLDEAARRGARVVLVRVHEDVHEEPGWHARPLVDDVAALAEAKHLLDTEEGMARRRHPGLDVSVRLVHGAVVPVLRDESDDAQLLVVGVGSHEGRRVGPVAAHLATHARCSVAVVRPVPHRTLTLDEDELDRPVVRPVVVGVDGSRASVGAAYAAARAASGRDVPLEVVHARPGLAAARRDALEAAGGRPGPTLDEIPYLTGALREAFDGLEVRTTLLDDDPAHALVDASRRAQLLVVASHGTGAFPGMLLGAVADHVLRAAACTVLVVHGQWDDD